MTSSECGHQGVNERRRVTEKYERDGKADYREPVRAALHAQECKKGVAGCGMGAQPRDRPADMRLVETVAMQAKHHRNPDPDCVALTRVEEIREEQHFDQREPEYDSE